MGGVQRLNPGRNLKARKPEGLDRSSSPNRWDVRTTHDVTRVGQEAGFTGDPADRVWEMDLSGSCDFRPENRTTFQVVMLARATSRRRTLMIPVIRRRSCAGGE